MMTTPRIWFYHDGRHPHIYRYEPPMRREEYVACIDELAGTPVEAVSFCLGEGRTMLHDTKVGELLGHNVEEWGEDIIFRRAHQNAKGLIGSRRRSAAPHLRACQAAWHRSVPLSVGAEPGG